MSRKQPKYISLEDRYKLLDQFWTMVALLENKQQVKSFFKDLISETEAVMLARRIQIALMLFEGYSYDEITEIIGAGSNTVARVHHWLQSGFGGYENALPILQKEIERRRTVTLKKNSAAQPHSWEWMKKKYPLYFLIFSLADEIKLRPPKRLRFKKSVKRNSSKKK